MDAIATAFMFEDQVLTSPFQLSSQLKTRLSYAMVKVQNGWQSHNLSELESLTSAPNSAQPSPLVSPVTSSIRSPRSRPTSSSTIPDRPFLTHPSTAGDAPHQHIGTAGLDYAYRQPPSPTPGRGTRTYESFWREHSDSTLNSQHPTSHHRPDNHFGPSLAPPADIHPRRNPRLQTSSSHNPSISYASYPSTPPPPPLAYTTKPKPRTLPKRSDGKRRRRDPGLYVLPQEPNLSTSSSAAAAGATDAGRDAAPEGS